MNVIHARRLAAVKKRIREEPRRFDMRMWVRPSNVAPCGTAACIAGHLVWRSVRSSKKLRSMVTGDFLQRSIPSQARRLLGIYRSDLAEECPGMEFAFDEDLFFLARWPRDLVRQYEGSWEGTAERAEVACQAIDRFLAERGFGPDGERLPTEGGGAGEGRP